MSGHVKISKVWLGILGYTSNIYALGRFVISIGDVRLFTFLQQ